MTEPSSVTLLNAVNNACTKCSGGSKPFLSTWERLFGTNRRCSQPRQTGGTRKPQISLLKFHVFLKMQVKENHKWWYKPHITREDAINLLKSQSPGTFIVRDSNSFPDSFGLALKVLLPSFYCSPFINSYQRFPIVSGDNSTSEWATAWQRSAEFRGAGQTHSLNITICSDSFSLHISKHYLPHCQLEGRI